MGVDMSDQDDEAADALSEATEAMSGLNNSLGAWGQSIVMAAMPALGGLAEALRSLQESPPTFHTGGIVSGRDAPRLNTPYQRHIAESGSEQMLTHEQARRMLSSQSAGTERPAPGGTSVTISAYSLGERVRYRGEEYAMDVESHTPVLDQIRAASMELAMRNTEQELLGMSRNLGIVTPPDQSRVASNSRPVTAEEVRQSYEDGRHRRLAQQFIEQMGERVDPVTVAVDPGDPNGDVGMSALVRPLPGGRSFNYQNALLARMVRRDEERYALTSDDILTEEQIAAMSLAFSTGRSSSVRRNHMLLGNPVVVTEPEESLLAREQRLAAEKKKRVESEPRKVVVAHGYIYMRQGDGRYVVPGMVGKDAKRTNHASWSALKQRIDQMGLYFKAYRHDEPDPDEDAGRKLSL